MQTNRHTLALILLVMSAVGAGAQRPVVGVVSRTSLDSLARKFPSKPLIRVSGSRTEPIPATKDTVALRPGELLIKETGRVPTIDRSLAAPHFDLPEGITAVRATGGSAMFTVALEPQGLAYAPDGVFVGTVHVGLNDSLRPDSTIQLARPVHVLLSAPAGDAEFDSTDLRLSHTNLPFTPVRLRVRDAGQDSVHVTIRAASGRAVCLLRRTASTGAIRRALAVAHFRIGAGAESPNDIGPRSRRPNDTISNGQRDEELARIRRRRSRSFLRGGGRGSVRPATARRSDDSRR